MSAVFAIPGDKDQRTGGYIYDATVLDLLNQIGCPTAHLELPSSFPNAPAHDMETALNALRAVPASTPVIVDGLALGAMPPEGVASIAAPVIALVHHPLGLETGTDPARAQDLIRNEAAVLEHVAHVIVTSTHIGETLWADFGVSPDRITVASPGFLRPMTGSAPVSPPLILSVGLLSSRKGHDVLISALAQIADLSWQAEIIGRPQHPDYTAELQTQVSNAGLANRIQLRGEVDGAAIEDAYRRASMFALATRYEGYGMVLSEAMLHGLPVVSCAVGAVPETVGYAGRLVPADQPDAFAAELRTLLEDPDQLAKAAHASLEQSAGLPSWHDTTRHFADVIKRVAESLAPPFPFGPTK
ncbi:glycosyltransferase family 4 protein [Ruegeria sp. HU-ET01832]|uniref:glycosyltransferase family 4 protein n=1 Tax=Ruegeria sp. HU-ET01832 TaxID=3135906 RepID=UPI003102FFBA